MNPRRIAYVSSAVIILILIISIISCIYFRIHTVSNSDLYAVIYQDGTLVQQINMQTIDQPYAFTITGDNNSYNVIEIRNNAVGITKSSCPDKTCVHMGFISKPYFPIVCLPNHLLIQIETKDTGSPSKSGTDFDAVVY